MRLAKVLTALLLIGLCYWVFVAPPVHYRNQVRVRLGGPEATEVLLVPRARILPQDRALLLVPEEDGPVKLRLLVRNNLRTAAFYHSLRALPPTPDLRLELQVPPAYKDAATTLTAQPSWSVETDTESDYARKVGFRLLVLSPLFLLPLLVLIGYPRLRRLLGRG